ncbi:MAG: FecR domain-containing protein, partial [Cyclobacteriaceae bacterium]|nr:FecR domain-containing protein [Cyclobacteriaceae bacterium]
MKSESEHIEYLDLITKNISGEISVDEGKRLDAWLGQKKENQQIFDSFQATWNEMDRVKGKSSREVDMEWERLENAIDFEASTGKTKERSLFGNMYKYAAVLLFMIVAAFTLYFYLNNNPQEQLVAELQIQEVELSEGSKVTINSNSKLTYPKKFEKSKRVVALSGEAFFEVAKDPKRPFIINAGEIRVEVLGTSFNVKAHETNDNIEVTVSSGKVAVYRPENPDERVVLIKGQKAIFYKSTTKIEASINDNINFNAWKTKQIIFEDTPMPDVVRIINEIYKSDLKLVGGQLNECPVTTTFDNQSLESI